MESNQDKLEVNENQIVNFKNTHKKGGNFFLLNIYMFLSLNKILEKCKFE